MTARRFFLLFLLCALVPLVAAKVSLSLGWFSSATVNKGQWMTQEVELIPAVTQGDLHWTIAYSHNDTCDEECMAALGVLQKLHTGLGRKQLGVQAMFVSNEPSLSAQHNFPSIKFYRQTGALNLFHHHFLIINQQGVVLLRYPVSSDSLKKTAGDLRSDLLRLFNYDRSRL